MSNRKSRDARRAELARMQAEQRQRSRRRNLLVGALVTVAVLALVVPTVLLIVAEQRRQAELEQAAGESIAGLQEYADLSALHTEDPVSYDVVPPVGGAHNPVPQNCGFYAEPILDEHGVHSLEHGAVWVTYRPDLGADQVTRLRELAADNPYLLVTPYPDLPSPVVASAWGLQLQLPDASDDRLEVFLHRYLQGPQTPEPGAPCAGGVGDPLT